MNTDHRLLTKLREQLGFIRRSCSDYDRGAEEEALRIATALRVMFNETKRSKSLLSQLGLSTGEMLSTSRGHGDWQDYLSVNMNFASRTPMRMTPILGDRFHAIPLEDWWCREGVFVHAGEKYTRRLLIKSAANKDGGAHVDAQLERYYEALQEGRWGVGMAGNFTFSGIVPFEQGVTHYAMNGHLALIRQFAHEVVFSARHFGWLPE